MRTTLPTVPESLPSDHVSTAKVSRHASVYIITLDRRSFWETTPSFFYESEMVQTSGDIQIIANAFVIIYKSKGSSCQVWLWLTEIVPKSVWQTRNLVLASSHNNLFPVSDLFPCADSFNWRKYKFFIHTSLPARIDSESKRGNNLHSIVIEWYRK